MDREPPRYTREQLGDFCARYWDCEDESVRAAVRLVTDVLFGPHDPQEVLGLKRRRGARGASFPVEEIEVAHPAFGAACLYADGQIGYSTAVEIIIKSLGVSDKTAKRLLKALKPKAARLLALWQQYPVFGVGVTNPWEWTGPPQRPRVKR